MTAPSDLGVFGKLPPEIRLCIWDLLVPSKKHCFMNEDEIYDITPRRRRLEIMCTSQRLHDEVLYHLYGDFHVKVRIKARDPRSLWIKLELPKISARWGFYQVASDNFEQVFEHFPFQKAHLKIHLCAPDPRDRGQLVLLWIRLNRFISFLVDHPPVKSISLVFDQSKKDWLEAQKRLHLPRYPPKNAMFYDHEALALQLFRLEYCQHVNIRQSRNDEKGLFWSYYNQLLSIACPFACSGPSSSENKDSDMIQKTLKDITHRMLFKLTRENLGPTAEALGRPCKKEEQRLLNEQKRLREQELKRKKKRKPELRRKQRELAQRRTEFWLTHLVCDQDGFLCQCDEDAHGMKMVDVRGQRVYAPRHECDSDGSDFFEEHEKMYLARVQEPMFCYICG